MIERKALIHGYLAAFATLLMWTSFSLTARLGGKSVLTAWDVMALRLMTASLILLPIAWRKLPPGAWRDGRLWLLAIIGNLFNCLLAYRGFNYSPASHGAILLSGMQPFLITGVAWLLHGSRPSRGRFAGLVLIGAGIGCAAAPYFTHGTSESLYGDALILMSSICWAFYSVLARQWGYSAWTLTCALALGSSTLYLPVYWALLPRELAAASWSMILTQCFFQGVVATILAMLSYIKAISILGTERAAVFLALVPIVTGLLAVPLLGEALSLWTLSGLLLVSTGSFVASRYASVHSRS